MSIESPSEPSRAWLALVLAGVALAVGVGTGPLSAPADLLWRHGLLVSWPRAPAVLAALNALVWILLGLMVFRSSASPRARITALILLGLLPTALAFWILLGRLAGRS